jgi:enterochelin esterase-like enzyme
MRAVLLALITLPIYGERQQLTFEITWLNPPPSRPAGVQHRILHSKAMQRDVGYNIWLPPDYESSGRRYPVIYWLHGSGGNESSSLWIAEEYQKATRADGVEPALIVFPNGGRKTEYRDWQSQNVMPETMIVRELIPHIDETFRTVAAPEGRSIEGMSMGANGALKLAFKYPELFHSVVAYAGSYKRLPLDGYFPSVAPEQQAWIAKLSQWYSADDDVFELAHKNSARLGELRIRFVAGTKDIALGDAEALHPWLSARGIPHEYEILLGVGHDARAYYRRSGLSGFRFHFFKP